MSDEELAKPPPVPHGVNVGISIGICFGLCVGIYEKLGHPEPYQDLLGEPLLDPTYMFGLRYRSATEVASPSQGGSALRIIATVSAQTPDYQVALIDMPSVDGIPTYHLELTPLRKPKVNRLRELWVATTTYLPIRAIISGNFTIAPLVDVPWTVSFSTIDGAPYITREVPDDTLYLQHRRVVRKAVIAFEDVREASGTIYDLPLVAPEATDTTLVEPDS